MLLMCRGPVYQQAEGAVAVDARVRMTSLCAQCILGNAVVATKCMIIIKKNRPTHFLQLVMLQYEDVMCLLSTLLFIPLIYSRLRSFSNFAQFSFPQKEEM